MRFVNKIPTALTGLLCAALFVMGACSGNPVKAAQTPSQKAYALYGTFSIFEQQGARMVVNPSTLPVVIKAIQVADAKAKPIADSLYDATLEVIDIQNQIKAGTTTDDKLVIATNNLNTWVTQATPLIQDLVAAVGSVTK